MKMYSDNAVQAADLETAKAQALLAVDTLEAAHKREIDSLRFELRLFGMIYGFSALGAAALYFFR
jgi:hypothetical protein